MKQELFVQVRCEYPDNLENGELKDGRECIEVQSIEDLYKVLKEKKDESILDHVHLAFGTFNSIGNFEETGELVLPFTDNVRVYPPRLF